MSGDDDTKADRFELFTALLLGFTALGAALASLQAGQWGGKQLEAFSESNTMTTLAARDYNESVSSQNADYAIVAMAKQLLIDAAEAETDAEEARKLRSVSYLYSNQLTWQAMKALGLSEDLWSAERTDEEGEGEGDGAAPAPGATAPAAGAAAPAADEDEAEEAAEAPAGAPEAAPAAADADEEEGEEGEAPAAAPAPEAVADAPAAAGDVAPAAAVAAAPEAEEASAGEAAIDAAMANMLPEELLWGTIDVELHDEDSSYTDDLFTEPMAQFERAAAKFAEGQTANNNGDQFDLAGVFYTVALFFAGVGLVFKSKTRWPFFGLGVIVFLATTAFMATLPWAG